MVEGKSIEALSLMFTLGIAVGTLLAECCSETPLGAMILPVSALPFFFYPTLSRSMDERSVTLILLAFLCLGIFVSLSALPFENEETGFQLWIGGFALKLKNLIAVIPFSYEGTSPLLSALLTGDKSEMSRQTIEAFRNSGASHVLALSGLHMGILYMIFSKLTAPLGKSPASVRIRSALIVSASLFFTLMTGAGASIVRAFLFICIGEAYTLSGRRSKPSRVLCLALLIQLVINPGVIRGLGFQLSYLAMAGIVILYPVLEKWYPEGGRINPLRKIWQMAAISISCQLFTGPLAWYRFGTIPQHFLLTNLMAIPLVTILMGSAVTCIALYAMGICPELLIKTTDGLSRLLVWVLEIISS